MAAKRQAVRAHANTYLGQVMRGEKKMKRFVRTGGGQVKKKNNILYYLFSFNFKVWEDPSLAEWDPNDFRIFCGDLGNEVSDELLAKAFRKYPSFQKAKVVRDNRTNKSKGYGFVSFKHQDVKILLYLIIFKKILRILYVQFVKWMENMLEIVQLN